MSITATELKSNLGKYLKLAENEDIFITRNGKVVAKTFQPQCRPGGNGKITSWRHSF